MEIFRPYGFDKILFTTTLILIAIGLLMVFSSSGILASEKYHQPFYFFINQIIVAGIGIILIGFIISVRKPIYQNFYFIYGLLFLSLFLLVLCLFMPAVGNTNRWIQFLGLRFQPSELAKLSLILFLGYYLSQKKDKLAEFRTLLFPLTVLFIFILFPLNLCSLFCCSFYRWCKTQTFSDTWNQLTFTLYLLPLSGKL